MDTAHFWTSGLYKWAAQAKKPEKYLLLMSVGSTFQYN
jgi:hypothetical protein